MVRRHQVIALVFAVVAIALAPAALAQPDPFAPAGSGSADGSAAAAGSAATVQQLPSVSASSPACEYITKSICGSQNTGLLLKTGAYVLIAVLIFSLLRAWWDKRGTNTAGVRFVVTLLSAGTTAGVLAYLDPTRGQDLKCCLASFIFKSEILLQDSAIARGAVLGFLPAVVLFVLVAIVMKIVKG